jgi:hypothetical protein
MATQRRGLAMWLMLTMASGAYAQEPDSTLQALKAEALDADAAAAAARLAQTDTDAGKVLIYVGGKTDKLLLRNITLRIDDRDPVQYEYSDPESFALRNGALHALILPGLPQGMHHLRVDFYANDTAARPGSPRQHGQSSQDFRNDSTASVLELELVKNTFISDASVALHILNAESTEMLDAQIRATDFLAADRRYFPAASALMQFLVRNQGTSFSDAVNTRLAASLRELGLADRATTISNKLAAGTAGIAGHNANDGDPLVNRYNQALALIQQGKAPEGAAELEAIGRSDFTDPAALSLRDQANLVLGYYLLDRRQGAAAIPVFSRVRSPGPCANPALLGLGWALLTPQGPIITSGLAENSSDDAPQRFSTVVTPRLTADIVALKQEQPPRVPTASKEQQLALRRALVAWTELTGRDPTDPAVQEGVLATAWSLYHFGAYEQAQDNYLKAADQFDKMRGWFDAAIQHVRSGGMTAAIAARDNNMASGWHWSSVDLPPARAHWWLGDTPETPREVASTFYMDRLLLNDDFADALQNYRDLRLIADTIDNDQSRLQALDIDASLRERLSALRPRVSAAIESQGKRLEEIAVADLVTQKKQLEKYLVEARFALASIYDRPALAENP